jgi:hypothetical protein
MKDETLYNSFLKEIIDGVNIDSALQPFKQAI